MDNFTPPHWPSQSPIYQAPPQPSHAMSSYTLQGQMSPAMGMGAPLHSQSMQSPMHPLHGNMHGQMSAPMQNTSQVSGSQSNPYRGYQLVVKQHPEHGRAAVGKEKDKKPLDPPAIIELKVDEGQDPNKMFLQSPYLMVIAFLVPESEVGCPPMEEENKAIGALMSGTTVSSLHRLKDTNNADSGFFVFSDLIVKKEGRYRIRFNLLNLEDDKETGGQNWYHICHTYCDPFVVHGSKTYPGMAESTFLTRSFSDQGVRLRLRKDSRQLAVKKRNVEASHRMCRAGAEDPDQPPDYYTSAPSSKRIRNPSSGYSVASDAQTPSPSFSMGSMTSGYSMHPTLSQTSPFTTSPPSPLPGVSMSHGVSMHQPRMGMPYSAYGTTPTRTASYLSSPSSSQGPPSANFSFSPPQGFPAFPYPNSEQTSAGQMAPPHTMAPIQSVPSSSPQNASASPRHHYSSTGTPSSTGSPEHSAASYTTAPTSFSGEHSHSQYPAHHTYTMAHSQGFEHPLAMHTSMRTPHTQPEDAPGQFHSLIAPPQGHKFDSHH